MKNFINYINERYLDSDAIGYEIGNFIYHITPEKNLSFIKENGFIPQDGISINGKHFENRLYFATSLIAAYDLSVNFGSYKDDDNYIIFKIESSCISDYEEDPLFVHGIYIDYSISEEYIVDILKADDYFNKFDDDDIEKLYEGKKSRNVFDMIDYEKEKELEKYINKGNNINLYNGNYEPLINYAISNENMNMVNLIIDAPNFEINIHDEKGKTPLMIACKLNNLEIVKLLLNNKDLDINQLDHFMQNTLLYLSPSNMTNNNLQKIFELILKTDIDVNNTNKSGYNILMLLFSNYQQLPEKFEFVKIMKLLIDKGLNINHTNIYNMNVLHVMTKLGIFDEEFLEILTENKIDWNLKDNLNNTFIDYIVNNSYFPDNVVNNILNNIEKKYPKQYNNYLLNKDLEKFDI